MKNILVIGTGGLAREFTEWFKTHYNIVAYFSINETEHTQFKLPGKLYTEAVIPDTVGTDLAVVAIASPAIKEKMYEKFAQLGFKFPVIVHPSSVVSELSTLNDGVVISPQCVIGPNTILNKFTYVNFCCGIGHDTTIGSFTQINPGVQIGGACNIGTGVLVGSGATIIQCITVGDTAIVGSGATVFTKVNEATTVIGNPARKLPAFERSVEI